MNLSTSKDTHNARGFSYSLHTDMKSCVTDYSWLLKAHSEISHETEKWL